MENTHKIFVFFICFISLGLTFGAEATNPRLYFNSSIDLPIISVTGLTVGAFSLLEEELSPSNCRWCDRKSDGTNNLNGLDSSIRNQIRWSETGVANNFSHLTGFVLTPAFALGSQAWLDWKENDFESFYEDAFIISEATLIAGLLGQIVQFSVGREKPDTHFEGVHSNQSARNTSFYSGHSNIAFALATSSGTVASLRNRSEAPFIWAGGLALAGLTSYLRLASDRHYFTDVLVGAATGSAIGFAIPYFFHPPVQKEKASVNNFHFMILPTQASVEYRW